MYTASSVYTMTVASTMTVSGNVTLNGTALYIGSTGQTGSLQVAAPDQGLYFCLGTSGYGNNALLFVADANKAGSYGRTTMLDDPTTLWYSRTAAGTSTAQWFSRCHRVDHGVDATGTGGILQAPYDGEVYFDNQAFSTAVHGLKTYHETITLDTTDAETAVTTITGTILAAAILVAEQVTGLDSADHHLKLGVAGTIAKYCDASQGGAATTIDPDKKAYYAGAPVYETSALILTIDGGGDNTPSAGKCEVMVLYIAQGNIPNRTS